METPASPPVPAAPVLPVPPVTFDHDWEDLFGFLRPRVMGYLVRMAAKITLDGGRLTDEDVEDSVQDSHFKAWRGRAELTRRDVPGAYAWILRVARNTLIDKVRWFGARPRTVDVDLDALAAMYAEEEELDGGERLREAMKKLPEIQQGILWMRYSQEEPDWETIGRAFDMSGNNAQTHAWRARMALRRLLDPDGREGGPAGACDGPRASALAGAGVAVSSVA